MDGAPRDRNPWASRKEIADREKNRYRDFETFESREGLFGLSLSEETGGEHGGLPE